MKSYHIKLFLVILLIQSCATPQQLIQQNVIYKGMNKSSLWNAMVDMNIADDVTLVDVIETTTQMLIMKF